MPARALNSPGAFQSRCVKSFQRQTFLAQRVLTVFAMPYALFCNEARLSKTYPTEADVWKLARRSGLVVDAASKQDTPAPRPVLDNDYEIRPCRADPQEDPEQNRAEAEREARSALRLDR